MAQERPAIELSEQDNQEVLRLGSILLRIAKIMLVSVIPFFVIIQITRWFPDTKEEIFMLPWMLPLAAGTVAVMLVCLPPMVWAGFRMVRIIQPYRRASRSLRD